MVDLFEDGYVDVGIFQPTSLRQWYTDGFNTTERNGARPRSTRASCSSTELGPARRGRRSRSSGRARRALAPKGRQALHRGVDGRLARWKLPIPRPTGTSPSPRSSGSRTSTCTRDRRSGRSTRTPSTCPTSTTRRPTSRTSTSSSSMSACRASRTSASWPRRSPTCTPGCPSSIGGLMHARPRFFAKVMGELLFWVGEDKMTFGSDYCIWEPKWQVEGFVDWDMPDGEEYADYPRLGVDGQEEDPRAQRGRAVRHRGAVRAAGIRLPTSRPSARRSVGPGVQG